VGGDERHERALRGEAMPLELLSLLEDFPELQSIELAKLSHPLDAAASKEMAVEVDQAIIALGEEVAPAAPYYKPKGLAPILPAATVLRKQVVADYATEKGRIQVLRRETLLVRGDKEVRGFDPDLPEFIRDDVLFGELAEKIERYSGAFDTLPDLRWLQPLATSYYAKYVLEPESESGK